jgi:hypothetical protein
MTELFFKGISGSGLLMENFAEPSCLHNPLILFTVERTREKFTQIGGGEKFDGGRRTCLSLLFFQDPFLGQKVELIHEVRFCLV